ncbi:hypothetical protein [Chitinimonas taiwanensis]|uniref:hypothetical protein n=1 Tax=Chitinimonas taiwanensis TaxID=240412 RepID=UPI0035AF4043
MPGSTRLKTFLLAIGTGAYANDTTPPAPATAAVLCRNVKLTPIDAKMVSRDIDTGAMGHLEDILVGATMAVEGEVEFAGSGTAGSVPAWGTLLRTCHMAQVVTAGADVTYNPISDDFEWANGYYYYAGKLHKLLGCRGTWSLDMNAEALPVIKYKLMGLYGGVTDAPQPAGASLNPWKKPLAVNAANTPIGRLFGQDFGFAEFSADMAVNSYHKNVPGEEEIRITDRAPVGSITIPDPDLATKNFFESLRTTEVGDLVLTHGRTAGARVGVSSDHVQVTKVDYVEREKEVWLKLDLKFTHSAAGNDDLLLKSF